MTIVAAIDRTSCDPRVVEQASELAEAFDEELHVAHALSQSEFVDLERTNVEDTGQPIQMDRIREIAANIVEETVTGIDATFMPVGLVGDPAKEIIRYSQDQEAHYIVIGGRKRSPVGKALFGSVAQSILLRATRPVVTVTRD